MKNIFYLLGIIWLLSRTLIAQTSSETSIKILSPQVDERISPGSTYKITWKSNNVPDGAYVVLYFNGSYKDWAFPPNGSYEWRPSDEGNFKITAKLFPAPPHRFSSTKPLATSDGGTLIVEFWFPLNIIMDVIVWILTAIIYIIAQIILIIMAFFGIIIVGSM